MAGGGFTALELVPPNELFWLLSRAGCSCEERSRVRVLRPRPKGLRLLEDFLTGKTEASPLRSRAFNCLSPVLQQKRRLAGGPPSVDLTTE